MDWCNEFNFKTGFKSTFFFFPLAGKLFIYCELSHQIIVPQVCKFDILWIFFFLFLTVKPKYIRINQDVFMPVSD